MITAAFLIVILFLGGWHFWGLTGCRPTTWSPGSRPSLRIVVLLAKVFGVILFFMLVRWSWPRFRFDQLMALAWKVMLPLGLVNLVAVAVLVEYRHVAICRRSASAAMAASVGMVGRWRSWPGSSPACSLRLHTDNRAAVGRLRRSIRCPRTAGMRQGRCTR